METEKDYLGLGGILLLFCLFFLVVLVVITCRISNCIRLIQLTHTKSYSELDSYKIYNFFARESCAQHRS